MTQLLPFVDPWAYILMSFIIMVSAFLQGVGGVGFTMFAAPVALMVSPELVPGPLLTLGGMATLFTAIREKENISWSPAVFAVIGRSGGAFLAVIVFASLSQEGLNILFSCIILVAVGLSVSGLRITASRLNLFFAGWFSGIMGTLTSVGSPPLAIALQNNEPPVVRSTIGTILASGALISLIMLWVVGKYNINDIFLCATLSPFLFIGFKLSNKVRYLVDQRLLRKGLLIFCTISALILIFKVSIEL